jgi:uncharacterized protein (TIGR03437 family)
MAFRIRGKKGTAIGTERGGDDVNRMGRECTSRRLRALVVRCTKSYRMHSRLKPVFPVLLAIAAVSNTSGAKPSSESLLPAAASCGNRSVVIIVDPRLLAPIRISLDQFEADLCAEGYNTIENAVVFGNPPSLRSYLQQTYSQMGINLKGAILIGDLPHAYQQIHLTSANPSFPSITEEAISFQYYADLDGTFSQSPGYVSLGGHAYSYDVHSGSVDWEIWVGVLPIYKGDLATSANALNRYFAKNHEYRHGHLATPIAFVEISELYKASTAADEQAYVDDLRSSVYSWTPYSDSDGAHLYVDGPSGGLAKGYAGLNAGEGDFTVTDTHGYWGASGQLSIAWVETKPVKTSLFWSNGCAVGDLDHADNFLTSILYSATSNVVLAKGTTNDSGGMGTNANGFFGHNVAAAMAAGMNIGDAILAHVNVPLVSPWSTDREFYFGTPIVLGDPTLTRIVTAAPPHILTDGSGVINGGSYLPGNVVSGSWVSVKGEGFTDQTVDWSSFDFSKDSLPTTLNGVQVLFNGQPGAVWYLIAGTPQQINVQAPANVSGNVSVQVIRNGIPSNIVTTTEVQVAPAIFAYTLDNGKNFYPSAVFLDGTRLGDPAIFPGARKATAGDHVSLYANSLAPSPAGVVTVSGATHPVTVTIGPATFPADFAGVVAPGEFLINITVPGGLSGDGNYPITLQIDGQSSQTGILFPYTN